MSQAADLLTRILTPAAPRLEMASHAHQPRTGEPSLGERKAQHREEHLCLKCNHHLVCGMAKSLDPNLLVTITSCLGFEPDRLDDCPGARTDA
jgi:hypothetical protein